MADGPPMALAVEGDKGGVVVVALDATRDRTRHELRLTVDGIRVRGDILKTGNTLLVLGVLHSILNPMGYLTKACTDSFGGTSARAIEEEVSKKVEMYESMLLQSSEQCEAEGASFVPNILANSNRLRMFVIHLATSVTQASCFKETWSSDWSMSSHHEAGSSQQGKPGMNFEREYRSLNSSQIVPRQQHKASQSGFSEEPILCAGCNLRSVLYLKDSMKFNLAEIQAATSDFSRENFLGEGGFGHVYKGQLKDGQAIAAKVRKEASSQGYSEFFSEENYNILVYEYICNKSLEWHLFNKSATSLEWHKRRAIAIGTAKGLRFLHEECRGGPIIHRDMRPSNILLTHDFVPMALPLVESLALHELIDRRIEDSYDTYELYHLARAAYLCVRRNPEERPSMGEVVRLLEGENDYFRELAQQFIPHCTGSCLAWYNNKRSETIERPEWMNEKNEIAVDLVSKVLESLKYHLGRHKVILKPKTIPLLLQALILLLQGFRDTTFELRSSHEATIQQSESFELGEIQQ
ncbi:Proline-rich receptor-like protein kinase PERK12 [Acorus gramineus]|uniref:Proline-rich receptor-like protein kinase PERK12 n=1 Tax=Acorus gramineus TaxID=55184 RepID=A0AAV9BH07_ACOGR|nr:Proline-rich receptor-like protein kinase PERK12 [Acorus gramineus]